MFSLKNNGKNRVDLADMHLVLQNQAIMRRYVFFNTRNFYRKFIIIIQKVHTQGCYFELSSTQVNFYQRKLLEIFTIIARVCTNK